MLGAKKHLCFTSLRKIVSGVFRGVPEHRQILEKVVISIHDAMLSGLACMFFQDPSLLEFQKRMNDARHKNNLQSMFDVAVIPKETQMRSIIDEVPSHHFGKVFKRFYDCLQRGKYLERFQIFSRMYYVPMDGSQFFSSGHINCPHCLTKEHVIGSKTYEHQVLQGGIMHPDCKQVIPLMPEQISNKDGMDKQDCEMNAAKRMLKKCRQTFPKLNFLIGGDALFSKQPLIEDALSYKMNYLFVAKPTDHISMMKHVESTALASILFIDDKGNAHEYEWLNGVALNGGKDSVVTNFLRCTITPKLTWRNGKLLKQKAPYKNSWVTNLPISENNIKTLVRAGRCRWKNENECFNTMKNQGYCMDRNYGHGQKNLAFNVYLLTVIAFFMHQIFELSDGAYQDCRKKFGSKRCLWNTLRSYVRLICFDGWDELLKFALHPDEYQITRLKAG
jgi:hypothetical protein